MEEGNGHLRDLYLKELNVQTYLVIDPRVSSQPVRVQNRSLLPAVSVAANLCVSSVEGSVTDQPKC